jgi:hypothetical protein
LDDLLFLKVYHDNSEAFDFEHNDLLGFAVGSALQAEICIKLAILRIQNQRFAKNALSIGGSQSIDGSHALEASTPCMQ